MNYTPFSKLAAITIQWYPLLTLSNLLDERVENLFLTQSHALQ
jgi:hypothetical protein